MSERRRVLIVDDSPEDREMVRRYLARAGPFEFVEAASGEEALASWRAQPPDLALLDVQLPDLDGLEVLAELPEDMRRGTAVLILTGQGNEETAAAALRGGAHDYLVKNALGAEALCHAAGNALEKVSLQRQVAERTAELARANAELQHEVAERRRAEAALQATYAELEELVVLRTAELSRANLELQREIGERRAAELEREEMLSRELEARAEAERANRAKDEFLGTVSHELRTPLNAILGWIHLLRSSRLDGGEHRRALEIIERNARLQAQIISDLLDVSRITTGKLRMDFAPVSARSIIEAAVSTMLPAADAKRVELRVAVGAEDDTLDADPDRLQQVVCNLLGNAVKFTPEGGRVEVEASASDDLLRIVVSDSGAGIDGELLPRIFDRFRQGARAASRAHGGLGLGLAIVKHIVEEHHGRVAVESEGPGRGARFSIELPRRQAGVARGGADPADAASLDGVRVLVVEDEQDTRDALVRILEERGARAVAVGDAPAALAALDAELPDVIVSDIGLPGMDGFALLREIRARGASRGGAIPALAMTAYARDEDRSRALESGFAVHLAKPIDPARVSGAVARLARKSRLPNPS